MKKIIALFFVILLSFYFPTAAKASSASFSFSSAKNSYSIGDTFKVKVSVNANGNNLILARAKISYPSSLLKAEGFTLGNLFPLKSPGEEIGNGLIYTGGYRLGSAASESGVFGYITFKVIAAGAAEINAINGSRLITSDTNDVFIAGNSLKLTLASEGKATASAQESALAAPEISSSTNPIDTWSKNNNVIINWTKPSKATGYITKLSNENLDDIGNQITTAENSQTLSSVSDGIWFFYLKAKYPSGFSKLNNYTLKIDATAPSQAQPIIKAETDTSGNKQYLIYFASTDETSGIDRYQIKFDDGQYKDATSPYTLNKDEEKAQTVFVKAIDKAGNESEGSREIKSYINSSQEVTLFDVQTSLVNNPQIKIYLATAIVFFIFALAVYIFLRKKSKK